MNQLFTSNICLQTKAIIQLTKTNYELPRRKIVRMYIKSENRPLFKKLLFWYIWTGLSNYKLDICIIFSIYILIVTVVRFDTAFGRSEREEP